MEGGQDVSQKVSSRNETTDGKRVFLFRYDNPQTSNKKRNSEDPRNELVGSWFTDSIESLKSYIKARPQGGSIIVIEVPKDKVEELKAINHPVAKDMDIEPLDNYIVPHELLVGARSIPLTVPSKSHKKFLFEDWTIVNNFVDGIVSQLKETNS